jgi:hypothetical protein
LYRRLLVDEKYIKTLPQAQGFRVQDKVQENPKPPVKNQLMG